MPVLSRRPRHPLLVDLVDVLWFSEGTPSPGARGERILPNGRAQLVVSCGGGPADSVLVGPQSQASEIDPAAGRSAGVSFTAGGLSAFAAWSVAEISDSTLLLDEVGLFTWNTDRAHTLAGPAVLTMLESMLLGELRSDPRTGLVRTAACALGSGTPAGGLATSLGLDRRTFVPEFRRRIGFAPKHYERIVRFQQALVALRQERPPAIASIAADLGFSDQAHLSREMVEFAGLSPSQLWGRATSAHNHIGADKIFKT